MSCGPTKEQGQALERMEAFFDARAEGYDDHMRRSVASFDVFYEAVATVLPQAHESMRILDLGVGTGLQLDGVFRRLPSAAVHGIDVSAAMLDKLGGRSRAAAWDLSLQLGSFIELEFGCEQYDAVISTMALHHQLPEEKLDLYRKIRRSLRPGGLFVNGDYVVSRHEAERIRKRFLEFMADQPKRPSGTYHLDLPLCIDEEVELLEAAGFVDTKIVFETETAAVIASRRASSV
ncbi:class I SAM-dependent methyltransferase [Candidatus Bipolaricaulota bacterium]|nr:class I SAM-dependent methyltransferase [Candidatus Bipolaricaulota bacterium]